VGIDEFQEKHKVGTRVVYMPPKAKGDAGHPDCEKGEIIAYGDEDVFVIFDKDALRRGKTRAKPEACDPEDLKVI
jgi:hypothetical protein